MLVELSVRDLGVIAEASLVLGPGMTALTGETGAGKTLVVEALGLLLGGRADPVLVRAGAAEALVEGRFEVEGRETVLARALPASGRSRAWLDTRMAPLSALAEAGAGLVELHGQHAHQVLLAPAAQRAALDAWGGVDHGPRDAARAELRRIDGALAALGGDARARAREIDLLRFQVGEIASAGLQDPGEEVALAVEEDRLAGAQAHREAALSAVGLLGGEAADAVGAAGASLAGHGPLAEMAGRLRGVGAELADIASEVRRLAESLEDDPARLEEVRARRQLLRELQRKYGDGLGEVIAFGARAAQSLAELESHETRVAELEAARSEAVARLAAAEQAMGAARREAAPGLGAEVERRLRSLAMPRARLEVAVGEGAGEEVAFGLGANPGEPVLPLAKVASGGELSRAMLALRLALGTGAGVGGDGPTLVFDEVDAGIGGEAALALAGALSELAATRQVLVVTHLAQVAAFADHHVSVGKSERAGRTVAELVALEGRARVVELSRMLSGQPASAAAAGHAAELLELAARARRSAGVPSRS